jgi:hypothetical protein
VGVLLEAFILAKNLGVIVSRIEPKLANVFDRANIDLDLVSMVLNAINVYAEQDLGCKLGALVFIEQVNLANPRLFDLPASSQMNPLGSGTSFRLGQLAGNADYMSYIIDRVLLKNDDFLLLDDNSLARLTEIFYKENMAGIEAFSGQVGDLRQSSHQGEFDRFYTQLTSRERRGTSMFQFNPILVYGKYCPSPENPCVFAGNPLGYELKHDIFQVYFSGENDRKLLFELIEATHKLHSSLYRGRAEVAGQAHMALLSFVKDQNTFLLVEYKNPVESPLSPAPPEMLDQDYLGIFFELEPDERGINLSKLVYKCFTILKGSFTRFTQGGSISFIDANIEKELKQLR